MTRPPLTGWAFTDAVRQVMCSNCGAVPGVNCKRPSGRRAWPPHSERMSLLYKYAGTEPFTGRLGEDRKAKLATINKDWVNLP